MKLEIFAVESATKLNICRFWIHKSSSGMQLKTFPINFQVSSEISTHAIDYSQRNETLRQFECLIHHHVVSSRNQTSEKTFVVSKVPTAKSNSTQTFATKLLISTIKLSLKLISSNLLKPQSLQATHKPKTFSSSSTSPWSPLIKAS